MPRFTFLKENWREIASRVSLPMLAGAASYGVYTFNLRFVPEIVSIITAASFEMVYIGLAVARLTESQLKRARNISYMAVGVSILCNVLGALFDRIDKDPKGFAHMDMWATAGEVLLACVHGVPLALLAFFVSDLLVHSSPLQTGLAALQALVNDLQAKIDGLQNANNDLQTELYHFQEGYKSDQDNLQDARKENQNLQATILSLQIENRALQESSKPFASDPERLANEIEAVCKSLTQRKLTASEARDRVRELLGVNHSEQTNN